MKFWLIIPLSLFVFAFTFQDEKCKYDSILELKENENIPIKQVTKLSYYSQVSRFSIRRDYNEIDLIFSSVFGIQNMEFESFEGRDKIQNYFGKKDYIMRIQFKYKGAKLEVQKYSIGDSDKDSMQCVVRLYHIDKTKRGVKLISRKYPVKKGQLEIEKISAKTFCGQMAIEIPQFYNLSSAFSLEVETRDN